MKLENYLLKIEEGKSWKNKENICLYGVSSIIKSVYFDLKRVYPRNTIKIISDRLGMPYQTLYSWISGNNPISKGYALLKFWKEICNKSEKEFIERWDLVYRNTIAYSQNGQKKVILPKELTADLAYIIGFFQGDGHLKKEKGERNFQEHSIYFYESDKEILNMINKLMYEQFGIYGNIYFQSNKTGKWNTLRICSKQIYLFFKNVLNLKTGKKVRGVNTPEIIKKSEISAQLSFIRGFFDAEGSVGETKKNHWLEIGQASKDSPCEILIWIKNKLDENGINLSEPKRSKNQEFYKIRTAKRETIKRFFDTISSEYPAKINKFRRIIKE